MKDYYDADPEQAYGNIIGRNIIDEILAQPGCDGLIIYPALRDGKRTLVYGAIDADGKPIQGIIADMANAPIGGLDPSELRW